MEERQKNGEYKSFTDFCERIQAEAVNKKCIESLIKAGAFDEFEQTRSTLMASFEDIVDAISDSSRKNIQGQVSMFDLGGLGGNQNPSEEDEKQLEKLKYSYTTLKEYTDKELLSMEKEMLGLYISGHPLEQLKEIIEKNSNISTLKIKEGLDELEQTGKFPYKDGQTVKFIGIINSIKKKYTKNNKIMAFLNVEDLYGNIEVIVFENCYQMSANSLIEDNIVLIEGRLSIKEEEQNITILASKIKNAPLEPDDTDILGENNGRKTLEIDITNLTEEQKNRLRGALRFFAGDKNNTQLYIINNGNKLPAGGIFLNGNTQKEIEEIVAIGDSPQL